MLSNQLRMARPPIQVISTIAGTGITSGVTSVTFSGHKVGDFLLAVAGSQQTTDPTFTSGWTKILNAIGNTGTRIVIAVYKIATSTASDTVTFTGTGTSATVYSTGMIARNVSGVGTTFSLSSSSVATTSFSTPTIQAADRSGRSLIVWSHFNQTTTNISGTPTVTTMPNVTYPAYGSYLLKTLEWTVRTVTLSANSSPIGVLIELKN